MASVPVQCLPRTTGRSSIIGWRALKAALRCALQTLACLAGLRRAAVSPASPPPANLAEFLERSFGKELCDLSMRPYNRKVWADPFAVWKCGQTRTAMLFLPGRWFIVRDLCKQSAVAWWTVLFAPVFGQVHSLARALAHVRAGWKRDKAAWRGSSRPAYAPWEDAAHLHLRSSGRSLYRMGWHDPAVAGYRYSDATRYVGHNPTTYDMAITEFWARKSASATPL